ncbi:MAG: peptide ABC transporter substrate-binding protein [Anaerolineaceae bacterium]|nr:peptide ABC transporter substrate-binding protein [Anaerolineaceae bacterium]
MKKIRWQLLIILFTGLVVGLLLISEQPGTEEVVPEPVQGGIYTEALIGQIQRLNPVLDIYNDVDQDIDRLLFSGLISFDSSGQPQPDLAESWGISQDGLIYNFTLRDDAKWHDGEAVTNDDIRFTIDLIRAQDSLYSEDVKTFWNEVQVNISPDNAQVIQFVLPEPFTPFLDYLSFGVLPRHLLDGVNTTSLADHSFNLQPIGSGPYRLQEMIIENEQITGIILIANQDYYLQSPYIETIIFRFYANSQAALAAYQDGVVMGIGRVDQTVLPEVLKEEDLSLYTARNPEMQFVFLNLNNPQIPFFQEIEIRRALYMGLNRQWIVNNILDGQAYLAHGPILPGSWAYYDGFIQQEYLPEEAIIILQELEYIITSDEDPVRQKEDVRLEFELVYPNDAIHEAIAQAIQADWALLNVKVNIRAESYENIINNDLANRTYQAALVDINLNRMPDPDPYPFWDQAQATGGQNYSQWDNRPASEYLEQARISTDFAERQRMYRNFQYIFENEVPSIPLFYPVYNYAVSNEVNGVRIGPLYDQSDRFVNVTEWYLLTSTGDTIVDGVEEVVPTVEP